MLSDWLPTLMGIATNQQWSGSYVSDTTLDGVDFWPSVLSNTSSPRSEIIHYADKHGYACVQSGDYKYLRADTPADIPILPPLIHAGSRQQYECSDSEGEGDSDGYSGVDGDDDDDEKVTVSDPLFDDNNPTMSPTPATPTLAPR